MITILRKCIFTKATRIYKLATEFDMVILMRGYVWFSETTLYTLKWGCTSKNEHKDNGLFVILFI